MRGIEIMLMSIYSTMRNGTDYNDGRPPEIDGDLDLNKLKLSLADMHSESYNYSMPTEISVTSWQNMPYSGYKSIGGQYVGEGYAFQLLDLIKSKLNFSYTIIPPDRSILGDAGTGVISQLYNKKVDMAVAFLPVMPSLNPFCDFSPILDVVEITFLMKRPSESATGSGLLAPFNKTVWLCILFSLVIVGPTIYILIFIRSRISGQGQREKYSLSTCMWFVYGALLKQGSTASPVTDSTRLLFATWWIFITILTSFYTANLTAFLTLSEFTLPFKTVKEVVQKHQKWISLKDYTLDYVLRLNYSEELEPLKQSKRRNEGKFVERDENFETILQDVYQGQIFLGDRYHAESIIIKDYQEKRIDGTEESLRCTFAIPTENIFVNGRAFAYPKNSPLQEHINKYLLALTETGIVKHLESQDVPSVKYCPLNLKSTERRLRNSDLTMTYKVVGVGFAIAAIVFLCETLNRFKNIRKCFGSTKCCDIFCCHNKMESTELPVYSVDSRTDFTKQKPSPVYESVYNQQPPAEKHFINGRDYWVINWDGDKRLVPIRTPSALLFQYSA